MHLAKRCDARDRLLAEGPGVGHGANQFAVDVNRTAAHALDDTGLVQAQAGQPAQDEVAARTGILEDAQHLGVEGLDLGALHDGLALALHAGAQVGDFPVTIFLDAGAGCRHQSNQAGHKDDDERDKQATQGGGNHCRASSRKRRVVRTTLIPSAGGEEKPHRRGGLWPGRNTKRGSIPLRGQLAQPQF